MNIHLVFLTLGGLLLVGMIADEVSRRARVPRVTLMILCGVAVGPSALDLLPSEFQGLFDFLSSAALTMVAFLLGGRLSLTTLRRHGRAILAVSAATVLVTAIVVGVGLMVAGASIVLALLLAGISTATDPAATQDVTRQARAKGPFTDTLLGVVAMDDAWGIFIFSLFLVMAKAVIGDGSVDILQQAVWEISGAIAVGVVVGLPAAFLTGRLHTGEPIQAEALGVVFLCAGLAIWLDVSFLLAGMTAGVLVVNFAKHHTRPFHEIEHIEWPFMVLFFVLAGASLSLTSFSEIGVFGAVYVALRVFGRIVGGWTGGAVSRASPLHRRWFGVALLPQAGVALGMALVAASDFPDLGQTLLAITISTTILFEVFGPLSTQRALTKVGEVDQESER